MIYLLLSILLSSAIFIIFRYFSQFKVNNFQAITFNYLLASAMGLGLFSGDSGIMELFDQPWLYLGIIEGVLFITVFIFFAFSSQRAGVGITAVASKMSVIIPVIFGIILYGDSVKFLKITGIITALIAFYLSLKKNGKFVNKSSLFLLPLLLFLGNGTVDTVLKVTEHFYLTDDKGFFLSSIFLTALIIGSSITLYMVIFKNEKIQFKNIAGGFVLGSVNYLTTYFTLLALEHMESSIYYPLYNSGIVALTAFLGIILFKEKYTRTNWGGDHPDHYSHNYDFILTSYVTHIYYFYHYKLVLWEIMLLMSLKLLKKNLKGFTKKKEVSFTPGPFLLTAKNRLRRLWKPQKNNITGLVTIVMHI